jgi:ribosomal protein S18 acetylase RimI-like enzyme
MNAPLHIEQAESADELAAAFALIREYADALGVDLCFQDLERELAELPGAYAPPRGRLLLARGDGGSPAGCVALRPLGPDVCEMKRLYVRPAYRSRGLGRAVVAAILNAARNIGYRRMVLDTLATMAAARALYESFGFRPIAPYYDNPIGCAVYLGRELP